MSYAGYNNPSHVEEKTKGFSKQGGRAKLHNIIGLHIRLMRMQFMANIYRPDGGSSLTLNV